MARRKKEVTNQEFTPEQPKAIVLPNEGPIVQEPESIAILDKPIDKHYADALKFGEDELEILINPSSEENAPKIIDVYVNGEAKWVQVGVPTRIKRKFVEALLRSKPMAIQTDHEDVGYNKPNNRILRSTRAKYPISIQHDPSPKGGEWLRLIASEQ